MTITEFLLARIAQDEGVRRANPAWIVEMDGKMRPDPAPMAELEAKRLILDEHEASADPPEICFCDGEAHPCPTVRALALPYAAHPDYDPAWSVTAAT